MPLAKELLLNEYHGYSVTYGFLGTLQSLQPFLSLCYEKMLENGICRCLLWVKHVKCSFQTDEYNSSRKSAVCCSAAPAGRWLSCLEPVLWYCPPFHFEPSLTSWNWALSASAAERRLPCASRAIAFPDGPVGTVVSHKTSHHIMSWASWETWESSSQTPLKHSVPNAWGTMASSWLFTKVCFEQFKERYQLGQLSH